ncbi:MAG: hypothetical protein JWO52_1534 [Gammaproteobacteria bacterium]|nr:hypothetical protein [Gammaproteobacteria bacterium]
MTRVVGMMCFLLLSLPCGAGAQKGPESSLTLRIEESGFRGEWKVSLLELSSALQLDANRDGEVTWPEIEHRRAEIEAYLGAHLQILPNRTSTPFGFEQLIYGMQGGRPFILARLTGEAAGTINTIGVNYSLPQDRCTLKVLWAGEGMHQAGISAGNGTLSFERRSAARSAFAESLEQGIWHIWTGYDHILFLIVLLIPAVFQRTSQSREAVPTFRAALLRVVIIVSAFTVAHSVTLGCAAMGWIHVPARLVESVIAASIFVAALNNFLPRTAGGRGAWLAFGFGLIHGFGFAGALSEIGAEGGPLWRTLAAFNLGVEAGQLGIVALFLPIAFLLRQTRFYRTCVVYGGSSIAGLCALFWFWERAFRA